MQPTYRFNVEPAVTGMTPWTRPPRPPATEFDELTPAAPTASTCIAVTPAGTVYVWAAFVQPKFVTDWKAGAALASADFGVSLPALSTTLTR